MSLTPTRVTHTFSPVYDQNSKILILGTFPSVKSREGNFYYHHPQNRFWKVLSRIFGVALPQTVEEKKAMLLTNRTAVWDVIASCEITGSSDSSIKNVVPADIRQVLNTSSIEQIYANGNKAYELYMKYCFPDTGREIIQLPSTSPANAAFSLDKLTAVWQKELTPLTGMPDSADTGGLTLEALCQELSISYATGKNWLKSGRLAYDSGTKQLPLFSQDYVSAYKKKLSESKQELLKSRRNKSCITGNSFYHSYLMPDSPNISSVKTLLERIEACAYPTGETGIRLVLAQCAIQLYRQCNYVNQPFTTDLINNPDKTAVLLNTYPDIFSIAYTYVPGEDLLGLLYLSMCNIGSRKINGAYYTPTAVVHRLLADLPAPQPDDTLADPCCGTGNFLLQLSDPWQPEQLYGSDIDETSVTVTRINLSLKYPKSSTSLWYEHIRCENFLTGTHMPHHHFIIGNPPWGVTFSEPEKKQLRSCYKSAGKHPESYDLFIEKALMQLYENGTLAFIIPQALLTVRSHQSIRQIICENCQLQTLTYLGDCFDDVWCPSVILQLVLTNRPLSVFGARITTKQHRFTIQQHRLLTADNFNPAVTDEEYSLLEKIEALDNSCTLKGNAQFALGIVTGNNKWHLIAAKTRSGHSAPEKPAAGAVVPEPILKGSNIEPYYIRPAEYYVNFQPAQFQQCAPAHCYYAPEKLVYRFIGNKLVFAYDDRQQLTLNSCNIVIPHMEGLHIKYILTILNSRIARFFVHKKWNSLKVLRSHLEQIPIPIISSDRQQYFITMADKMAHAQEIVYNNQTPEVYTKTEPSSFQTLYDETDRAVAGLYKLTAAQYLLITDAFE